jgi:glycosyltransferase involved in cell wall biosynthesis
VRAAEHLVVTSGSLREDERHEVVIHALHILQHVHRVSVALDLVVPASNGPYGAALRQLVHALRVTETVFIDAKSHSRRRASLAHAACFVSACSTQRVPGLRDAIAAGVPIIATSNPPLAGSIALPPRAGPLLVAEAILAVINDRGLRSALVDAGRDSSSHRS